MKKIAIFLAVYLLGFTEINAQSSEFQKIFSLFKEIKPNEELSPAVVFASSKINIDNALAHKFLWDKNPLVAPEDTKSHPIGYYKTSENIVVLVFSKERKDKAGAFLVDARSFNLKKGKLIGQFTNWGQFDTTGQFRCAVSLSEDKKTLTFFNESDYGKQKAKVYFDAKGKMTYASK